MSTPTSRLSVTDLTHCEHCAALRVRGELDQDCEQFFLRTIGSRVLTGHRHLGLDVTALTFCDSRGLNCLLAARWLLQRQEGMLLLAGSGRRLTELLAQTGSSELLPSHPTVSQAHTQHRPRLVASARERPSPAKSSPCGGY